jgi:myb proto-oncogene protein
MASNPLAGSAYERRAWTRKEDEAIVRLVGTYGTKRWSVISENLNKEEIGMKRTGKQCRTRCIDHVLLSFQYVFC